jgi:hypothetical protein
MAEQLREEPQVLHAGQVFVDGGELTGQADHRADGVGVVDDVVSEHGRAASVGAEQGGQHTDDGGLAGPVGPENAVDASGRDGQVEVVDGACVAEDLDQPASFDRVWCSEGGGHGSLLWGRGAVGSEAVRCVDVLSSRKSSPAGRSMPPCGVSDRVPT